jgi:NAD+ synthase
MMNNVEKIEYISHWICDYVNNMPNPAGTLVIGVSGGIDSALTSTLACLTGINTIVVTMPINTNDNQNDLGSIHSKWLLDNYKNAIHHHIDLTDAFKIFQSTLDNNNQDSSLGFANSKARLRMMTLYQVAASNHGLVIGTGNKVEDFGVGFYTKYGDGGVDISPIADLMKSEVRELSTTLGIDTKIINAEPTDGLWDDGRTDENQLGMSYEELEEAMMNTQSLNRKKYEAIRKNNSHKMNPIPVCKISKGNLK